MNTINLSIVIPCFNEEGNIFFLFKKIENLLEHTSSVEIIIIDNGSTDSTYKRIVNTDLFIKKKIIFLRAV